MPTIEFSGPRAMTLRIAAGQHMIPGVTLTEGVTTDEQERELMKPLRITSDQPLYHTSGEFGFWPDRQGGLKIAMTGDWQMSRPALPIYGIPASEFMMIGSETAEPGAHYGPTGRFITLIEEYTARAEKKLRDAAANLASGESFGARSSQELRSYYAGLGNFLESHAKDSVIYAESGAIRAVLHPLQVEGSVQEIVRRMQAVNTLLSRPEALAAVERIAEGKAPVAPATVTVEISGGNVQDVAVAGEAPVRVVVRDYDNGVECGLPKDASDEALAGEGFGRNQDGEIYQESVYGSLGLAAPEPAPAKDRGRGESQDLAGKIRAICVSLAVSGDKWRTGIEGLCGTTPIMRWRDAHDGVESVQGRLLSAEDAEDLFACREGYFGLPHVRVETIVIAVQAQCEEWQDALSDFCDDHPSQVLEWRVGHEKRKKDYDRVMSCEEASKFFGCKPSQLMAPDENAAPLPSPAPSHAPKAPGL
jgi:hypothetical protein